jgi:hypothetical protein
MRSSQIKKEKGLLGETNKGLKKDKKEINKNFISK